jgi:hypothetical protein
LSSFPRSEREIRFIIDFAARSLYVVAPILRARLLPFESAARPLYVVASILRARLLSFESAARSPHVVALILLVHLLLEAAAKDA